MKNRSSKQLKETLTGRQLLSKIKPGYITIDRVIPDGDNFILVDIDGQQYRITPEDLEYIKNELGSDFPLNQEEPDDSGIETLLKKLKQGRPMESIKKSQLKKIIKEVVIESIGNLSKIQNEAISPKNAEKIEKWCKEVGNRKAAVKIIDSILRQRLGLESADLPDTATFANGLDTMEGMLGSGDYEGALRLGLETAQAMVEEEGGEGLFENDGSTTEHFINGQSNNVAASRVNKILQSLSRGMFSDNSWEAINNIFKKLSELGLDVTVVSAKYGGHAETDNGMAKYKEWRISIPFTNNKGKAVELVGQITAHGAGSVEQPLDRYDITAYVSPVMVKNQG